MIDTVTLRIPVENSDILRQDIFQQSIQSYGKNWHKWNKMPSDASDYWPKVALCRFCIGKTRLFDVEVRFSVPKLMYRNNLFEVRDNQFSDVCQKLQGKLKDMGVSLSLKRIKEAAVYAVHYGKNILCPGIPMEFIYKRLAEANLPHKQMDVSKVRFTNGNQVIFHGKTLEVCFYDKYQEMLHLRNSKLPKTFFQREDMKNILRMEVRFNNRESVLRYFGGKARVSFQQVFKETVAKAVLTRYWEHIYQSVISQPYAFFSPEYEFSLLPEHTVQKRLALLGALQLIRSMGRRAAQTMLIRLYGRTGVYALFRELPVAPQPLIPTEFDFLRIINDRLMAFRWLNRFSLAPKHRILRKCPFLYEQLLTVKEAAKCLKVKERTLQRHLLQGKCKGFMFTKGYRLSSRHLAEYMNASRKG